MKLIHFICKVKPSPCHGQALYIHSFELSVFWIHLENCFEFWPLEMRGKNLTNFDDLGEGGGGIELCSAISECSCGSNNIHVHDDVYVCTCSTAIYR